MSKAPITNAVGEQGSGGGRKGSGGEVRSGANAHEPQPPTKEEKYQGYGGEDSVRCRQTNMSLRYRLKEEKYQGYSPKGGVHRKPEWAPEGPRN